MQRKKHHARPSMGLPIAYPMPFMDGVQAAAAECKEERMAALLARQCRNRAVKLMS